MRHILTIEYEYCRVYLHSLALQAVIMRCVENTPPNRAAQPHQPNFNGTRDSRESSSKSNGGTIAPQVIAKWLKNDGPHIGEIVEGCRNILQTVSDGLLPDGYLKHCPVRTYFRVISVAVILLKTFVLGNYGNSVLFSLERMDKAIKALRDCIVDDVHIGNRFADVAELMTARMKSRLVRVAANGGATTAAASEGGSPTATDQTFIVPQNGLPTSHPATQQWANMQGQMSDTMQQNMQNFSQDYTSNGRMTPNTPNYALSDAQMYNPDASEHSIMPPPNFYGGQFGNPYDGGAAGSSGYNGNVTNMDNGGQQYMGDQMGGDWYAVPLDPVINSYGADVSSTMFGPNIGDFDLLDMYRNEEA
jgi:hypothetical protein